jgi:cell division septal protein FtsQ
MSRKQDGGITWMRGMGGRGGMRYERAAKGRRERARAHLEKMRARREQGQPASRDFAFPLRGVAVAISLAAGVLLAGAPWADRVEAIHVRGAAQLSPAEVAQATGIERGAELGGVDPRQVASKLTEDPWISAARVLRLPSGTLLLDVTERVPAAVVEISDGNAVFIDATGTPFASRKTPAAEGDARLPRIVSAVPVVPGQASPELALAVRIAQQLPALGLERPAEVSISAADDPVGYSLRLPSLTTRVVLGREDLDARLSQLAMLMKFEFDELSATAELDLRFAGQAVLRSKQRPEGGA